MMENSKLPISLVVVTLNEQNMIADCLRSASWCSEQIVFDSGSTDETKKIAEHSGAHFYQGSWEGFGKTKKKAALLAKNDWILFLDADERLSSELQDEIQHQFSSLDPQKIYYFPRRSYHLGRWIGYGGWYPDFQPRLFHRAHSNWNDAEIHEKLVPLSGAVVPSGRPAKDQRFQSDLHHLVFRDLSHQVQTNDRYSTLQAQELNSSGETFSAFKLLTKPWVKFIENYVWKQGFRDGWPGFIIAVGSGYSVFLKWAKLWELQKRAQQTQKEKRG